MLHPEGLPLVRHFLQAGLTFWLIGGQAVELLSSVPVLEQIAADAGGPAEHPLPAGFPHHARRMAGRRDGVAVPTLTPVMHLLMDLVAAYYGVPLRERDEVDVRILRGAAQNGAVRNWG